MSTPIVAQTAVRIRADTSGFKEEAAAQVNAAVADLEPTVPVSVSDQVRADVRAGQAKRAAEQAAKDAAGAAAKAAEDAANEAAAKVAEKIAELQTRAQTAVLNDDSVTAGQFEVLAAIEQVTFAAATARRELASAVGADQDAQREFLEATIRKYDEARRKLEEALARSRATGKPIELGPTGGGGVLDKIGEFGKASGRSGGLGGLLAVGSRLGLIGLAATAAFTAVGELQQSLRVTGDEAFTTQGKLRNLGAELLGGNIVGGIKALTGQRQAEIASSITARLKELKDANDPLVVSEEKLLDARRKGADALTGYIAVLQLQGAISEKEAKGLRTVADELYNQERAALAAAAAIDGVATAISRAGSEGAAFGERGSEFGRGPGAIAAERERERLSGGTFQAGSGGQAVADQIRASIASRIRDEDDRLKAEIQTAKLARDHARVAFEAAKGGKDGAAAYAELVTATSTLVGFQNQQKNNAEAAAKAAKEAAEAEKARRQAEAERAAAERQAATEQGLDNAIAAAALTKRKSDDKAAFDAAIAYFENLVAGSSGVERARAQGRLIALRGQRRDALQVAPASDLAEAQLQNRLATAQLEGLDMRPILQAQVKLFQRLRDASTGIERVQNEAKLIAARGALRQDRTATEDLRLENARARAALTKGIEDDRQVILKQIARARAIVKNSQGLAREQARAKLIGFEGDLASLDKRGTDAGRPTTALDVLSISRQIFSDFASDIRPVGAADALQSRVDQVFPGGQGLDSPERSTPTLDELRQIRKLLEQGAAKPVTDVSVVNNNQFGGGPSIDEAFLQARHAKFAYEEAFNG